MTTVSTPRKIATPATTAATLAKGTHTPVNASSGALTMTLPTTATAGVEISVEKTDASANAVSVSGTIRGASSTIALTAQYDARTFISEGGGSWRPLSDHRTSTSLDARYAQRPTNSRVVDLPSPTVIAHKGGGANLVPEETMEAYRAAAAFGARAVDGDVNLLLDGSLAMMHDGTLDRTTTASGAVSDQTSTSFQQQTVDAGSWFGGGWGNLKPPLLSQLLGEFGNRVVMTLEAKSAGACAAALVADAKRFGVLESVVLTTSFWADIPTLVASGAHVRYVMTTGTEQTPAAIAAAGCKGIDVDFTAGAMTSTLIGQFHTAGLTVWGYTINRQAEAAAWMAKGGDGWYSDDPVYSNGAQNGYSYRVPKMPFTSQTYYHGHIAGSAGVRGVFTAPDGWGVSDTVNAGARTILAGAISPIKGNPAADTFTIDFTMRYESQVNSGRWMGFYVCFADDNIFSDSTTAVGRNGYRCLINGLGSIEIAKYTDGLSVGNIATATSAALTLPQTVTGKIIVTPTQITLQRTDVAGTATATDSTYRGGYVHFGSSGMTGRYTRVEVTA